MDAVTEESKLEATNKYRDHILLAQKERELYNECIKRSKETQYAHFTFDFSQNVSIPHYSRQMGPFFFTTPRKVQIFGFRIDGIPKQMNFLIDEDESIGKDGSHTHGPNSVISMIDWALHMYGSEDRSCALHAENCPGQNKNQFVIGYLMWLVMIGRYDTVEYTMQVPGHARCLVDAGFASLKQRYRRTDCDSMEQLEEVVQSSSGSNEAVRFPSRKWRDWKTFLGPKFRAIRGIREYQYFRFSAEKPGIVTVRQEKDGVEREFSILKSADIIAEGLPEELTPEGLSRERQTYLYKNLDRLLGQRIRTLLVLSLMECEMQNVM